MANSLAKVRVQSQVMKSGAEMRNSLSRPSLSGLVAICALLAGPAFADDLAAGPKSIVPPGLAAPAADAANPADMPAGVAPVVEPGDPSAPVASPAAPAAPMSLYPAGQSAAPEVTSREISAVPGGGASSGIVMGTLGSVDASSTGLIDQSQGSLGDTMWAGATRTDIDTYLAGMPVATSSPVMSDLARRLLLTGAEPPPAESGGPSLLATRLNRLIAAGDVTHALELANNAGKEKTPAVAIEHARAALAATKADEACSTLADIPPGSDPAHDDVAAFSLKLSAYCQIHADNKPVAMLTVDLAREEGLDDPLFYSLAGQAIDGIKLKADDPKSLNIIDAAFYQLAGRDLPSDAAKTAVPALLLWLARDDKLPIETRMIAAERAVMLRLMSGADLAALYKQATFTPADFDGLQTGEFPKSDILRRALLYQAVQAEVVPETRIRLIQLAFSTGESAHIYYATVQALLPVLEQMQPSPALKALAPSAVRAFLLIGDDAQAQKWFDLMTAQPGIGRNARELGAIMALSKAGAKVDTEAMAGDIRKDLASGEVSIREFAACEALMIDALGLSLPTDIWQSIVSVMPGVVGHMPTESLLTQLDVAARKGAVGETVMLAIYAMGDGANGVHPRAAAQAVASLKAVHLDAEAHRLATEALLARSRAGRG